MLVVSKLIGGLGNQMFQYAAGRAVAQRLGSALVLDVAELLSRSNTAITPRDYELGVFPVLAAAPASAKVLALGQRYRTQPWARTYNKALKVVGLRPAYVELGEGGAFNFNSIVAGYSQPASLVYLDGFWQNEGYFSTIDAQLRQELAFPAFTNERNLAVARQVAAAGAQAISVHVRRGDYLQFGDHGLCSVAYYEQALSRMTKLVGEAAFFVFSDDIAWVRAHLPIPTSAVFIDWNQGGGSYHDMHLMSLCRHHIIANSSFSWWGAWLNPHPDKYVISPRNWMGNPAVSANRVVPATWEKI